MGVQIPHRVYPERAKKSIVRTTEKAPRRSFQRTRATQRKLDRRRVFDARSVHIMIAIPLKYAVSNVVGYIKGKSAIHLARVYAENKRNFTGQNFWAQGYFVSTVGRGEEVLQNYIRNQGKEDERLKGGRSPVLPL